jgi:hypothetical protein
VGARVRHPVVIVGRFFLMSLTGQVSTRRKWGIDKRNNMLFILKNVRVFCFA